MCNMNLRDDGKVRWGTGTWHRDWQDDGGGNLIIAWNCDAQIESVKMHYYVRLQSDVDAWELKVRDERPITDKSWALLVLRKLSYSSTEDSAEASTEASTEEESS